MIRIAVVGLGAVTQSVHLPLLARRWDDYEIAALVDLSGERAATVAAGYGVAHAYTSVADLIAAHEAGECPLDAVLIATTGTHAPEVLAFAEAGIAVFAEKPLALSVAEIEEIIARAPDAKIQVAYMKEYDPAAQAARTLLAGVTPRFVDVEVLHPAPGEQLAYANLRPAPGDVTAEAVAAVSAPTEAALDGAVGADLDGDWRGLFGGVVLGSVIHDISLLRYLLGGITGIDTARRWGARDGVPGSVEALGSVGEAGLHLGWHFLPDYPDYRETVTIHHDAGSVALTFGVPYLLNAPTVLTVVERAPGLGEQRSEYRWNQEEAFENELVAFAAYVSDGVAPASGPAQALEDTKVGLALMAALARTHGLALGGEAASA